MTSAGLCFTSDFITLDQNWHHLYSSSAGGKDLSSDTRLALIKSFEPEKAQKCSEIGVKNLEQNFPPTTVGYSVVRIFHPYDAFSEILGLEASPEEGQQLQQKDKEWRKRKGKILLFLSLLAFLDFEIAEKGLQVGGGGWAESGRRNQLGNCCNASNTKDRITF